MSDENTRERIKMTAIGFEMPKTPEEAMEFMKTFVDQINSVKDPMLFVFQRRNVEVMTVALGVMLQFSRDAMKVNPDFAVNEEFGFTNGEFVQHLDQVHRKLLFAMAIQDHHDQGDLGDFIADAIREGARATREAGKPKE